MKKFLLYLLVLVFMVSFVGLVFYLTRDDETISASSETVYLNIGEESTPSYLVENRKNSTKVEFSSSDESVAKIDGEKIIANGKGVAIVSITLTNAKGKKQVIQEKVYVGDGSSREFPIYIRNLIDLNEIGHKYGLNLYFKQTVDITLTDEFSTIAGVFSGEYNGDGHKILNYVQTGSKTSSAMFEIITGTVGLLTFEDVKIDGNFDNASVVATTNKGLIDYVEVSGKINNTKTTGQCAGIVINNQDDGQIQRCVTKLNIVSSGKIIGGIAVFNNACITSCQNGDTSLKNPYNSDFVFPSITDDTIAGGIVAKNECVGENTIISNCYSISQIKSAEGDDATIGNNCFLGGIIGADYNSGETISEIEGKKTENIFGNYYLIASDHDLIKRGIGNVSSTTPENAHNLYVANGVTYETVSGPNSIFVSYVITFNASTGPINKFKSWPTSVWVVDSSYFPYLIPQETATNKLTRLEIDFPVLNVSNLFQIETADIFINLARSGDFTNPENAGLTYYILKDLDFDGLDFVMVGSETRPVVVNFEGVVDENGVACTLSNITITSATKYIETTSISNIEDAKPENIGIFGVVSGSTFTDFNLKNCSINTLGDITDTKNIGGIAGKAINSKFEKCSFMSDVNEKGVYLSSINAPASAENVGGLIGLTNESIVSESAAELEIACLESITHENGLNIGGIVGKLDSDDASEMNYCKFYGTITSNINTSVYAGSAAGFVSANSTISSFSGKGINISPAYVGGFAAVVKGKITNSSVRDTLNAKNAGGFAYSVEDNAQISNCYCETKFTLTTADVNAGMAAQVSNTCHFTNCVNVNDFNNDASSVKNYARTKQTAKFEFVCAKDIKDPNRYGSGYDINEVIMTNCFYVNRVAGSDSNDTGKTTFYLQTNGAASDFWGNHVDDYVGTLSGEHNGFFRNGRLNSSSGLAYWTLFGGSIDTQNATWEDFGFSSTIWTNANQDMRSATLYIA